MVIEDRIYGQLNIAEPVIAEIIGSKPMQRLKHISQDGAPHYLQPIRTTTRFEHSVGAWYLSHRLIGPSENRSPRCYTTCRTRRFRMSSILS